MNLLLTRSIEQSNEIKPAIEKLGYKVFIEPVIEIHPVNNIKEIIANIDFTNIELIIFTSINALRIFATYSNLRNIKVIVASEKSYLQAKQYGFTDILNAEGDANKIYTKVSKMNIMGDVLYLSGMDITLDLSSKLNSIGIKSKKIVIYQALATEKLSEQIITKLMLNQIDIITFFSERSAMIFLSLLKNLPIAEKIDFSQITLMVLSKKIASICKSLNWRNIKISSNITTESFLDLLKNSYDQERSNNKNTNADKK